MSGQKIAEIAIFLSTPAKKYFWAVFAILVLFMWENSGRLGYFFLLKSILMQSTQCSQPELRSCLVKCLLFLSLVLVINIYRLLCGF
jgi:hypothetical protein